jgi:hypothetical protein
VPLGPCPKCNSRVFETAQAYVCEKAVGPDKTCDFRSGRVILQRPVERPQMEKLLATGKTDLLQFVSARTKRPFSAFLVRQPDGKIGFEFEPRDATKGGARRGRSAPAALRVLGPHPGDKKPVELHSGRYGPYVKHGDINATVPDRDKVDSLTLEDAVALLAEKAGKQGTVAPSKTKRAARAKSASEPRAAYAAAAKVRKPTGRQEGCGQAHACCVSQASVAPRSQGDTEERAESETCREGAAHLRKVGRSFGLIRFTRADTTIRGDASWPTPMAASSGTN